MNNAFAELLSVWTAGPMLSIALTLAAFLVANWLFARFRRPLWMPPVLIAALLLAAVVALSGIGFEEYEQGARWLTVLLGPATVRSEEHTSELQSRPHLVCRLLLEKK